MSKPVSLDKLGYMLVKVVKDSYVDWIVLGVLDLVMID